MINSNHLRSIGFEFDFVDHPYDAKVVGYFYDGNMVELRKYNNSDIYESILYDIFNALTNEEKSFIMPHILYEP